MEPQQNELDKSTLESIIPFSGVPQEIVSAPMLAEGKALQKVETKYTTAITVQRPRSITRVVSNCLEEASLAGQSFYYGWNVKNKFGGKSWIEGPTIDLAMCVVRHYGNCALDIDASETPSHYMLKGYFIDLETGFTSPRLFRQRKGQSMGMQDTDRQEDIVFQIGQSKAIRNAIIRSMPKWLVEKMIEKAKQAVREGIGQNITIARAQAIEYFIDEYDVTQEQLESNLGRKADNWSAEDIVRLKGMVTALKENRVTVNELFPPEPAPEKKEPISTPSKSENSQPDGSQEAKQGEKTLFEILKGMRPSASAKALADWKILIAEKADEIRALSDEEYQYVTQKWQKYCSGFQFPARPLTQNEKEEPKDPIAEYKEPVAPDINPEISQPSGKEQVSKAYQEKLKVYLGDAKFARENLSEEVNNKILDDFHLASYDDAVEEDWYDIKKRIHLEADRLEK